MRVSVNGLIESVGWCVSRRMVVRMTGSWMERFDLWRLSSFSDETRWESNGNSAAIIPCFKILFVCLFVFWHFRCCFCCRWRCCCSCERDRVWLRPHWEVQASGNNVDLLSDRLEYSLILGCAGVVIGRDYLLRSSADFSTRFISSSCDFLYFLLLLLRFFMKGGGRIICWRHVSIAAFPLERIEMFRLIMISIMGGRRLGWSGPVLNTAFCKSMELHCKLLVVESENVERGREMGERVEGKGWNGEGSDDIRWFPRLILFCLLQWATYVRNQWPGFFGFFEALLWLTQWNGRYQHRCM